MSIVSIITSGGSRNPTSSGGRTDPISNAIPSADCFPTHRYPDIQCYPSSRYIEDGGR